MQYRYKFINHYLCIKVYTNSKRISQLINNFLDFNNTYYSKPQIKIDFYLDEVNFKTPDDDRNFLYQSWFDENENFLSSFGSRIVTVTTDFKKGIVKGKIFKFKEPLKESILDFIFIQPLRFILAHHGLFFLHSSMLCKNKDCILIIGDQDAGKSTLALVLSQNGFNFLADDDCFIKSTGGGIALYPFSTKMGLKDKVLDRYPELKKHTLENYRYGRKRRLSLNHLSHSKCTKGYRGKMMIFPKYKAGRNVHMKEISKESALERIVRESPAVCPKKELQKMFWALYSLTKETIPFELIYNDDRLNEIPGIVERIFKSCLH